MNKNSNPKEVLEEEGWGRASQNRTWRGRHYGKAVTGTKPRFGLWGQGHSSPALKNQASQ